MMYCLRQYDVMYPSCAAAHIIFAENIIHEVYIISRDNAIHHYKSPFGLLYGAGEETRTPDLRLYVRVTIFAITLFDSTFAPIL